MKKFTLHFSAFRPLFFGIFLFFVFVNQLHSQNQDNFTTSGSATWTAPNCVTTVTVQVWGGGGGGGGGQQGGGGGGGGYSATVLTVTPGTVYNLTVGAGGAKGVNLGANGGTGGSSWFNSAATVQATGGSGGTSNENGTAAGGGAGGTGNIFNGGKGGNAANGINNGGGGGGEAGGVLGSGAGGGNGSGAGGAGGSTANDGGGAGGNGGAINVSGIGGSGPGGGGGGGGFGATSGGAGAAGQILVNYYFIPSATVTNSNPFICSGQSSTLTAANATSYLWSPGGATTSAITVSPTATTSYTVTGNSTGCNGTVVATVTVYLPAITVNSVTICQGDDPTLTASPAVNYLWSTGATTASISVSPSSTTTYTVSGSGCGFNSVATSTVTVDCPPRPCPNANFSTCNFVNWTGTYCPSSNEGGTGYPYPLLIGHMNIGAVNQLSNSQPETNQVMYNTLAYDPVVGGTTLPVLDPAGSGCSIRLGNEQAQGGGETIMYKYVVKANSTSFTYDYAVVLSSGNHTTCRQPYFKIRMWQYISPTDSVAISCGEYDVDATTATNIPGFSEVAGTNPPVWYSTWNTVTIPLNAYVGQTVSIQFITRDCCPDCGLTGSAAAALGGCTGTTGGEHFCYAYLDSRCQTSSILATLACTGNATLTAPAGAGTYAWTGPGVVSGGSSQTATVDATGTYTVSMTTVGNTPCTYSLTYSLSVLNGLLMSVNSNTVCAGAQETPSILVASGTGAASYLWAPGGQTTATIYVSPASTTSYTVTATSAAGCSATATGTVVVNPLPVVTVNSPTICDGISSTLTATGGAASYSWSNGATTNSITVSPASTTSYSVTGTTLGCQATAVGTVNVVHAPVVAVVPATICVGQTATLTATGSPSGYVWSTGQTVNPISVSPAATTTYSVSGVGCPNSSTYTVTVNPLPVVASTSTSVCIGLPATLTASGANSYTWSTGAVTNTMTASPTTNTTYTVTGNSLGCVNTATGVITIVLAPVVTVVPATICTGQTSSLTATGASSYVWNTGASTDPLIVAPGSTTTYTVTGAGCANSSTGTVTVNPLPIVSANTTTICDGQGPAGTLTASGANSYTWSTGAATNTMTAAPTTTTTYTVTGSTLGCTNTATGVITVNPLPVVSANTATICDGQGPAGTLTASGANSYVWSTGAATNTMTAAPATTTAYTVTGTTLGCTGTGTGVITVNPLPVVASTSNSVCIGLPISITASGANSYIWSNATTTATMTDSPVTTTTYTVTGNSLSCVNTATGTITIVLAPVVTVVPATICAGQTSSITATGASSYIWNTGATTDPLIVTPGGTTTYTVTGAGCANSSTGTVTVNPLPVVSATSTTICDGQGPAGTLTASGANSYTWSTGAAANTMTEAPTTTTTYTVTGYTLGCTDIATGVITVNPIPVVTSTSSTVCAGSTTTLTASGANSYTWSNGATGASMIAFPISTTTYTVTGNSLGCVNTATGTITDNVAPILSATSATICMGQTATLTLTGADTYTCITTGTTGSSIVQSPALTTVYTINGQTTGITCLGTITATITVNPIPVVLATSTTICDGQGPAGTLTSSGANSYTWSTGDVINTITEAPTTTTTYTVTGNSLGCVSTATGVITVNPLPIVSSTSTTICDGQGPAGTLTAGGANSYTWSTGDVINSITEAPTTTTTYTVTGNSLGCVGTATGVITVNPLPLVSANTTTICDGQGPAGTLTAGGANSYTWSTGAATNTMTAAPTSTSTYTVTGNSLGCVSTATGIITVNPLPVVSATSTTICDGQGPAGTLTAGGANSYVWSDGEVTNVVTLAPTSTSTYTVTGSTLGCTGTATGVITVNPLPPVTASSTTICDGQGPAGTLTASGANSYTWSTGAATNTIIASPTSTATYTVTGNSLGCLSTATGIITVNPLPPVTASSTTICDGQGPAGTLTASGANFYTWSTGAATNSITVGPTSTTTYTVTGSTLGCTGSATGVITVNPLPVVSATSTTICDGQGPAGTLTATGANSYTWSTGAAINFITVGPTSTTTYTVTGSTLGCTGSATGVITVNPIPVVTVTSDTVCRGLAATLTAAGANSYIWSTGAATNTITAAPVFSTQYIVTGNSLGCLSTATGTITIVLAPTVVVVPATICAGQTSKLTAYGAKSYTWSNGSTKNPLSVTPAATTTYTVYGAGCPNSATGTVMVNPLPIVSVSSDTICDGQSATIYAKGANSYHWANGSTASSLTASPNITTTYSVVGTSLGCSQTASGTIVINPLPAIKVNNDTICPNGIAVLTASGASTYLWSTGSTNTSITVSLAKTTAYSVTGKTMFGCIKSGTGKVVVTPFPIANFIESPNPTNVFDTEIAFLNKSSEDVVYWHWNFGDGDTLSPNTTNPIHIYGDKAGSYTVTLIVHNSTPCWDTTSQVIAIGPAYAFYIPNSFTPNGDGINDGFGGKGIGIVNYQLWIFDRWGNFIWSADALNEQWDGRANGGANIAQEDVYVWKVFITDVFGDTHALMGTVTLIR